MFNNQRHCCPTMEPAIYPRVCGLTYFSEFGLAQGRGAGVVGPIVGLHGGRQAHVVPAGGQAVVVVHLHMVGGGGRTEHGEYIPIGRTEKLGSPKTQNALSAARGARLQSSHFEERIE
jgi:hypothetical protein